MESVSREALLLFLTALWTLSANASDSSPGFTEEYLKSKENILGLYDKWALQHRSTRSLDSDEHAKRFKIFKDNVKYMDSVNKKDGVTPPIFFFSDLNS